MQQTLTASLQEELVNILSYWMKYTPDTAQGGFYGKLGNDNIPVPAAEKGAVLNARILWTFAAANNASGNPLYLAMADRAYRYFDTRFIDKQYGGVYWTVTAAGDPAATKKTGVCYCVCIVCL